MFKGVMVVLLGVAVVVLVVAIVKIGGEPAAMAQQGQAAGPPAGETKAQPPTDEDLAFRSRRAPREAKNIREEISPEGREALGVNETTWAKADGKIHPTVYKAIEDDERPWPRPVGFEGTAYVQVHLKHEQKGKVDSPENKTAIKQLQSRVLSDLTAAQFHVEYPFQSVPCILGYADRACLGKLSANPDVIAICLDDKPMLKRSAHVTKDDLPPLQPGGPGTQPAEGRGSDGKVEAHVYQAVALHERVFVSVIVQESYPPLAKAPQERNQAEAESRMIVDRVLSSLTADEFWLQSRFSVHAGGLVNREGLAKLASLPDVRGVALDARFRVDPPLRGEKR
jgi:hypothetical protein